MNLNSTVPHSYMNDPYDNYESFWLLFVTFVIFVVSTIFGINGAAGLSPVLVFAFPLLSGGQAIAIALLADLAGLSSAGIGDFIFFVNFYRKCFSTFLLTK